MSDSAAFERQARALEGIERNTHELVKIFGDIGGTLADLRQEFKDVGEAVSIFAEIGSLIKQRAEADLERGKEIYPDKNRVEHRSEFNNPEHRPKSFLREPTDGEKPQ